MITVVNKRHHTEPAPNTVRFYVGRGTCLGNIYATKPSKYDPIPVATRDEAVDKYAEHLQSHLELNKLGIGNSETLEICAYLNRIYHAAKRGDVELECFCAPLRCHADVIKQLVESKL
jgi:hypothetical protein